MHHNHSDHGHGHHHTTTIIVNGREIEFAEKTISYSQVVQLSYPNDQPSENIEYTVAYANPHGKDGTLVEGQSVRIKERMIFNVTKTNRS